MVDAYKADAQWSQFLNIYPLDELDGIEQLEADVKMDSKVVRIYGIDGVQRNSMQKGINILRMSDGTSKTVICK